ncbi:MAG: hypothetical protein LBH16_07690 [Treponema sp.]|jgi:hypothetical protein|nr:hypothetical protein [Treponema sp.]
MKRIAFSLLLILSAQGLFAQEAAAQEQPDKSKGVSSSSGLTLQISTLPEAKLGFTQRFVFPFLQNENPLMADNNIDLSLTGEVSPVSLNGIAEAVLTPIAFFQFSAGVRIGSGWNINLFGGDIYGIGFNKPDGQGMGENDGGAFDGLLWKAHAGGAIQFDLAALFPGDWNHVVARSYHEINHRGYSRAQDGESWFYESDDGENVNGFNYYGNYLIGYQMPIFLDTVAFLAESDLYLYDTPGRAAWGDDKIRWTFSAVLNFSIIKKFGITVITQFRTRRNFNEPDSDSLYYRSRTLDASDPQRLEFYRVAAVFSYRFK